jgi:hypothetical protein
MYNSKLVDIMIEVVVTVYQLGIIAAFIWRYQEKLQKCAGIAANALDNT